MESSTRPERDLSPHITILLVEDVPGDARLLRETLADDPNTNIELEWITTLSSALERLAKGGHRPGFIGPWATRQLRPGYAVPS